MLLLTASAARTALPAPILIATPLISRITGVCDGSGFDVAERLRATGSSVPIILISGYDLGDLAPRAKALSVYEFVQNPPWDHGSARSQAYTPRSEAKRQPPC